jgi:hypothetical protein
VSAFPPPVKAEALSMPPHNGIWVKAVEYLAPAIDISRKEYPEYLVCCRDTRPLHRSPKHGYLLLQRQVLKNQLTLRFEQGE